MSTLDQIHAVLDSHAKLRVASATLGTESDLYAAGMTSHASVNVMLALEDAFEIEFPDELLTKTTFSSIATISKAIESLAVTA